jgi:eukaryotic-like serine/threonine-protein kinase
MPRPARSLSPLIDAIKRHELLEPDQLKQLPDLQSQFGEPAKLLRMLIRRKWLTRYQADKLLAGRGAKLALGPYLLLERLGKGGMGRVYKALHRRMKRFVVLKLIRSDRASPVAWQRFRREIQAVAQLHHANVVKAFDAAEVGGKLLLVMEYIEGSMDLADLVDKMGPVPVEQACHFISQAAQGLQHAHERGLVHRDIKPSNLLVTGSGATATIKLLDLGLARLEEEGDDGPVTRAGIVLGTPDFMAPEQALESHTVDIRADIYSLGCTMFFLLSGQVPFPADSSVKKLLMRQQMDPPQALESLCPDVPDTIAAVVRKMMARSPQDRYQEPREIAEGLREALDTRKASKPAAASEARAKDQVVAATRDTEPGKRQTPAKEPRPETRATGTTAETRVAGSVSPGSISATDSGSSELIRAQDSPCRQVQGKPSDAPPFSEFNLDSAERILARRRSDGKGSMTVFFAVAGALSLLALLVFLLAR